MTVMNKSILLVFAIIALPIFDSSSKAQNVVRYDIDPPQDIHVRIRLFKTFNIFTFIELDTRLGLISQVQYTINDAPAGAVWINKQSLLQSSDSPRDGRFTLYPTENMYNFILVDQDTGRLWQCQWSFDSKKRGLFNLPILDDIPVEVPSNKNETKRLSQ
jgi:hypothetical protein